MNNHTDHSTDGDAILPCLDDVWLTSSGRLADVVATAPHLEIVDFVDGAALPEVDFSTARLLYRHDAFVGDRALLKTPTTTLPRPTPRPRILLVGARRFCRIGERPYRFEWNWASMQRIRSIDEAQTPTAFKRLRDVGLVWDYAVDLLPPGDAWDVEDDKKAALSAAYLRGVAAALTIDYIIPLGGKVCKAFRAADDRVLDFEVGEEQHGYVPLPSPHARESTWWADEEALAKLRGVVAGLGGGK